MLGERRRNAGFPQPASGSCVSQRGAVITHGRPRHCRLALHHRTHGDEAKRLLFRGQSKKLSHTLGIKSPATGEAGAKTHGVSGEQHVLYRAARGDQAFLRMRGPEREIETRDHHDQEWAPVGLLPRLLFLLLGRLEVALDERIRKGFGQKVPSLRRNDDQSPGREESVIGRGARRGQDFLDLFAVGARVAQSLG